MRWSEERSFAYADVYLPAAGWGEKEGTVTNSERRISRVRAAIAPPGEAKPDWKIAVEFARRLSPDGKRLFPYEDAESIFNEHCGTTRGRDLDITGLSYDLLERLGPQQWPFPAGASEGRKRLYADGNESDQTLVAYTAEPDSPSQEALRRLGAGGIRHQRKATCHEPVAQLRWIPPVVIPANSTGDSDAVRPGYVRLVGERDFGRRFQVGIQIDF